MLESTIILKYLEFLFNNTKYVANQSRKFTRDIMQATSNVLIANLFRVLCFTLGRLSSAA